MEFKGENMQNIETELENDIKELEKLAKKKQLEIEEEKEDFDRKAQFLLVQLSQQQESIRLLVLEEFRMRILKAQEEYRKNQQQELKQFSMEEINQYLEDLEEKKQFTSKTDEENKQQEAERERNEEREKEMYI